MIRQSDDFQLADFRPATKKEEAAIAERQNKVAVYKALSDLQSGADIETYEFLEKCKKECLNG